MKYSLSVFFLAFCLNASAQYIDSTVTYNGAEYCLHKLQAGETLYQLARNYEVEPRAVLKANLDKGEVLALGELIRVPCKKESPGAVSQKLPTGEHQSSDTIIQKPGFIAHRVVAKETVYALCKKYNVTEAMLFEHNPSVKTEGLKEGTVIYFPSSEGVLVEKNDLPKENLGTDKEKGTSSEVIVEQSEDTVIHVVQPKETIYSLCKLYDIKQEGFFKLNPSVKDEGLKLGQTVVVGIKVVEKATTSGPNVNVEGFTVSNFSQVDSLSLADSTVFRIAIMLPFNFEKNKAFMDEVKEGREVNMTAQTRFFMEFVQGFKTAVDGLTDLGYSYQLFIYDTKSDSLTIKKIFKGTEFSKMDLIVGPAYGYNFQFLAKLAASSGVPLVSPYGKRLNILKDNWKAIKLKSSVESRVKVVADYVVKHHPNDHVILTYEGALDKKYVETLQQHIVQHYLGLDSSKMNAPMMVKGVYEPISNFSKEKRNVVVSLSMKENFATKLCGKLQSKVSEFDVKVIGMTEWKDYKNIEASYWDSLQVVVAGNLDYRYTGNIDSTFFAEYYKSYVSEPSYHAALAYDLVKAVVAPLKGQKYKASLILDALTHGLLSDYQFLQTSSITGVNNVACNLYQYKDFEFVKIPSQKENE